ncbi:protein-L-isoaspartate(D-aspartate) O-methyltransferase [Rhodoligotrophos appendicifer]|uniref:protein-L-isoaspartate O-methyltransferase family protein n=1 Tax=Rhodoligotrophos appendicifer TaxID=987056 RepID=UPI001184D526|nr:protein-L-isoaspartate O-methyltransferase [Rhodoligotrophos appendicifer]
MIDYATKRRHMVESQLRPNGITDARINGAMWDIPRELFVPPSRQALAYIDEDLALSVPSQGRNVRYLMEPMVFARLVQLADIGEEDLVLDVGCGLGYSAAVLSRLARSVVALEDDEEMARSANTNLTTNGILNVAVVSGPLAQGYAREAPFDVIFVNGQVEEVSPSLLEQLKDGGRLVAVIDHGPVGKATLFSRHGSATSQRVAFDASVGRLSGFDVARPSFVF